MPLKDKLDAQLKALVAAGEPSSATMEGGFSAITDGLKKAGKKEPRVKSPPRTTKISRSKRFE